ncbi:MAG: SulP family inorganic anion transporter, partial [Alphaproteobacteria bacterium]|nr:SulP family inorganic anion transporter [Alphaproteobacteria bacterium]
VVVAALLVPSMGLSVETIGSRFGGIPAMLPAPGLPTLSLAKIQQVLPDAVAFALLGAIESLLSAVVADGMTGRRHRSNCELMAQGAANIGSALFGGICVTGTVARTATNVRAGARGPIAGMLHALILLGFMAVAAPLVSYIPLAALAGILATVAWNMAERHAVAGLLRASRGDAVVLLTTFLLTVFRDLTEGIVVGCALGALLFIRRMVLQGGVEEQRLADELDGRVAYDPRLATDSGIAVYRLSGAFFFGTAASIGATLDRIGDRRRAIVVDLSGVSLVDSTAANVIAMLGRTAHGRRVRVFVSGASRPIRRTLLAAGARRPAVVYRRTLETALEEARKAIAAA